MLSQHVDVVRSVIRSVAYHQGLSGTALEELESSVWIRLIEHDYRAIRQFRGESSFRTFLRVVVTRLLLDLRVTAWGRWRPSALARRHGKEAMRFESLVFRDGHSVDQALAVLDCEGVSVAAAAVTEISTSLRSTPRRFVPIDEVSEASSCEPPPETVAIRKQAAHKTRDVSSAMRRALAALGPSDRQLLHLRHFKGLKVSTMAQALSRDQKSLYRRLNSVHRTMRRSIERAGLTRQDVLDVLSA
jgi:RNA polymerase sigma factor (sigma-70 family)